MKRECANCRDHIPPETGHFVHDESVYCTNCITVTSYMAHTYYLDGEYLGDSAAEDNVQHIESYEDDEYEEEANDHG